MKIHSMSCYSNQEANGTWDVRASLNLLLPTVQDVGAFGRLWQAFIESLNAPVQDAVIAEAPTRPEPRVEPVVEAAPVQADDVVVYATPSAPALFNMYVPDPIIRIENNTTPVAEPEPAVVPEPAPVVEEAPKQKRTRKKAEPAPEPVPAPAVAQEEPEQEDLFSAPPPKAAKVAVGTVKVGDQTFACTYNETGVYMTCKVVLTDELAAKLGVPAKQFMATSDTKKDAASIVAEEIQDYLEVQSWKSKAPASAPAPEPAPEPAPVVVPAPAPEPELTAADNPHVPPEVLRIMMDSRKLTDPAVRSEVLALWCKHLYHVIGIKTSEEILAHMNKHQSRLVIFEKKPLGSSVPKLIITLVEGYEKPVQPKRTAFKAEAPEAVTEVPGDEIDEDEIPF